MDGRLTSRSYTIRVHGHLDDHWAPRFADLKIRHHADGTSTLTGPLVDQDQLHGVLAGLRDIGAVLLDVRSTDPPASPARTGATAERRATVPEDPCERRA